MESIKKLKVIILGLLCLGVFTCWSQEVDSNTYHFNGSLSATNNGFSFIPSFVLGKPATTLNVSLGDKRFSFDPQFRFDLEGLKPWSFIFIWRYKIIQKERWMVRLGAHLPAIGFREITVVENGISKEKIVAQRFFTPELTTSFKISDKWTVGTYYIWGLGLEKVDQPDHIHFLGFNSAYTQTIGKKLFVKWTPQIYYLNIDGTDGYFAAHSLSFGHGSIPFVIATTMNKSILSDLNTDEFDWNLSLAYTFKNEFAKQ